MKSVLVVEDDQNIRELLCGIVEDLGMTYSQSDSAMGAIDRLNELPPSIVLLDMLLVDGDARPFIRVCQRDFPSAAIVLMSALNSREVQALINEFNIIHYLKKPFDLYQLEKLLLFL